MRGCNLSSGRFFYTTIDQSIKQQNSEGKALRTREIILRSPISIPLRFTAEGGGSFSATPWQLHSDELRAHAAGVRLAPKNPPSLAGVRALFVDDEADASELITMMLAQCGAEVRTADSAVEALAACDDWRP